MAYKVSKVNKYIFIDDTVTGLRHEALKNAHVTSFREDSTEYFLHGFKGIDPRKPISIGELIDSEGVVFTNETWKEFYTNEIADFNHAPGSGAVILRYAATDDSSAVSIALPKDVETLLPLSAEPFKIFNDEGKFSFVLASNWIDVSGINENAWITVRLSFLGQTGDADMIPSMRFINDKTDLSTYTSIHGQQSKQKFGRLSSFIIEGYHGGAEVIQLFLETDKIEVVFLQSITIKIEDVN